MQQVVVCDTNEFSDTIPLSTILSSKQLIRKEERSNDFDDLYLLVVNTNVNLQQEQEIHHDFDSIFRLTPDPQNNAENPVRRFTDGVPTKSVDPTSLPPPNRLMRRKSLVAV